MLFLLTVYCQQKDFTYLRLQRDKGVSLAAYVYLTQLKPFREVSRWTEKMMQDYKVAYLSII